MGLASISYFQAIKGTKHSPERPHKRAGVGFRLTRFLKSTFLCLVASSFMTICNLLVGRASSLTEVVRQLLRDTSEEYKVVELDG